MKGAKSSPHLRHAPTIPPSVNENLASRLSLCDFNDESCCFIFSSPVRMDTTEQCNAVISHFNGKFIKIASGALGRKEFCTFLYTFLPIKTVEAVMIDCRVTVNMSVFFFSVLCPQLPLSRCCVSLQTVRGRNMLRADLFPMDSQGISD